MEIEVKTSVAMKKLGANLALASEGGSVIYLGGELGVGKTTMVRGFLRQLGYKGQVRSPTFALLESYQLARYLIYHFDLYRLNDPEEFMNIGGRDYFTEDSICLIEWPESGRGFLPEADLVCKFDFMANGKGRKVQFIPNSAKGEKIVVSLGDPSARKTRLRMT